MRNFYQHRTFRSLSDIVILYPVNNLIPDLIKKRFNTSIVPQDAAGQPLKLLRTYRACADPQAGLRIHDLLPDFRICQILKLVGFFNLPDFVICRIL
jgi:hypothetical protein